MFVRLWILTTIFSASFHSTLLSIPEGNASTFTLLASGSSNTLVGQDDSFKPDDDEASIPTLPEQHSADPVVTPVVIPVVAPAEPPPAYVADATTSNNGTVGNATATAADARPGEF